MEGSGGYTTEEDTPDPTLRITAATAVGVQRDARHQEKQKNTRVAVPKRDRV